MIDTDDRCGLRQSIALHDTEAQSVPEDFCWLFQRGAAGNKRNEPPAESPMQIAKHPPSPEKMLFTRGREATPEIFEFALCGIAAFNAVLQRLELSRYDGCNMNTLSPYRCANLSRIERADKHNLPTQQVRDEDAHKLSENVAERQET